MYRYCIVLTLALLPGLLLGQAQHVPEPSPGAPVATMVAIAPVPPVPPVPPVAYACVYPVPAPQPAPAQHPAITITPVPAPRQVCISNDPDPAANLAVEKTKTISRSFKVGKDDKLEIENKYGKVHVNTGSKNEITVDVTIIARGASEGAAQEMLDKIKILETRETNLISFKTQLEKIVSKSSTTTTVHTRGGSATTITKSNSNSNSNFEINYLINMPKSNQLSVKNNFGDTYLGEFTGKTDLNISYGNLKTEKLNGNNNNIKIKFGSGNILYAKQCSLDVAYSNVKLDGSETLDLQSKFSDLTLPHLEDIIIKSKYDKLKIGKVNTMTGSAGYSECRVDNLSNTMNMKVQYCNNFEVKNASKNFKQINLEGGYSTFNLNFDDNTAFNFNVDLHYGNLKADKTLVNFNLVEKGNSKTEYQGKYGKANSKANVNIKNKYGDVKFVKAVN